MAEKSYKYNFILVPHSKNHLTKNLEMIIKKICQNTQDNHMVGIFSILLTSIMDRPNVVVCAARRKSEI